MSVKRTVEWFFKGLAEELNNFYNPFESPDLSFEYEDFQEYLQVNQERNIVTYNTPKEWFKRPYNIGRFTGIMAIMIPVLGSIALANPYFALAYAPMGFKVTRELIRTLRESEPHIYNNSSVKS